MPLNLTEEQRAILEHDRRYHARILAGPGTGKSTTMIAFLNALLQREDSVQVKMLTFTRAATGELAQKVMAESLSVGRPNTIHSFALSILMKNPGAGDFPKPLRIADTWEMKTIINPSLARKVGVTVTRLKKLVSEMAANWESLADETDDEISEVDRRRFRGAWHEHRHVFGYTLLQELPFALRNALHNHDGLDGINHDLLFVDEYQDLNSCDLEVLKLLSEKGNSIVIGTGDDDQSIYSGRKAAPEGIRRFLQDYAGARDYSLSVTLRCGKHIIDWANEVIQGDPNRPRNRGVLSCRVGAPEGEIALLRFENERTEAKGIAKLVKFLIQVEGLKPSEILILMRGDHNQMFSLPIKEALTALEVPYSDPGFVIKLLGISQNRNILARFHLLVDHDDSLAWMSLLELTNGIGSRLHENIYERANESRKSFASELISACDEGFRGVPAASANKAKALIEQLRLIFGSFSIPASAPEVGWGHWMIDSMSELAPGITPTDDFLELFRALDDRSETGQIFSRFLSQVEPFGKDIALAKSDGVRIMTMSGSKGLTVRATIVAGVEEGLVPRPDNNLSEERRILYVSMTRSTEYLYCTWARRRRGPTARAGESSTNLRNYSNFLRSAAVSSQDGNQFMVRRFELGNANSESR